MTVVIGLRLSVRSPGKRNLLLALALTTIIRIVVTSKLLEYNESTDCRMDKSNYYRNKVILAPMVRIGTLPMRLLSLDYGADIVYSEELIDRKLLRCERRLNVVLGTVDFIDTTDGSVVFRTCDKEKGKVILQIGTCNPDLALQAAKIVENDVAGIDVNMGCPKEFSIKGGMGAALLQDLKKAQAILCKLVNGLKIPVTCKIRVFNSVEETVEFCKGLAETGIAAIAVHGRTRDERPQHCNHMDRIRAVAEALKIPVIANGGSKEISSFEDIERFKNETKCSSVMIARAAEWDCSIFRKEGRLPLDTVIRAYLKYAVDFDNADGNTKYCVQNILKDLQDSPLGKMFHEAQTNEQICALWNLDEYCRQKQLDFREKGMLGRRELQAIGTKRRRLSGDVIQLRCIFLRNLYPEDTDLPKTKLLVWARKQGLKQPQYNTVQIDKLFQSVVTLGHNNYSSSCWEKNKKWAEQSAAIVCLCSVGVFDIKILKENGSIIG